VLSGSQSCGDSPAIRQSWPTCRAPGLWCCQ
jgi:hypothetical protein